MVSDCGRDGAWVMGVKEHISIVNYGQFLERVESPRIGLQFSQLNRCLSDLEEIENTGLGLGRSR